MPVFFFSFFWQRKCLNYLFLSLTNVHFERYCNFRSSSSDLFCFHLRDFEINSLLVSASLTQPKKVFYKIVLLLFLDCRQPWARNRRHGSGQLRVLRSDSGPDTSTSVAAEFRTVDAFLYLISSSDGKSTEAKLLLETWNSWTSLSTISSRLQCSANNVFILFA